MTPNNEQSFNFSWVTKTRKNYRNPQEMLSLKLYYDLDTFYSDQETIEIVDYTKVMSTGTGDNKSSYFRVKL